MMHAMPRMVIWTSTPASQASDILSMTSRSVREFILRKIFAASPRLARPISRSMPRMTSGLSESGATPRYLYWPRRLPSERLRKNTLPSSAMPGCAVSSMKSE